MQTISDISKETLTFLAFFDNEMVNKIPNKVMVKLCEEAADSMKDFFIDPNKNFEDQEISEESKNFISLIYYNYIADEVEKKEYILVDNIKKEKIKTKRRKIKNIHKWKDNDKKFEAHQKEIYNTDNLFKNPSTIDNQQYTKENMMIEYKESLLKKIINKLKNFFHRL